MLYILMMMVTTMQAANYDNWHPFILLAGILAFFAAGVLILGTWKVFNMIVDLSMISVISMAILVVWIIGDKCDASRKFIVLVEVILIKIVTVVSLQESTFASGGKNKAVKKERKIESFGSYLLQGEGGNLHPRPWGAWQETKPCGRGAAAPL